MFFCLTIFYDQPFYFKNKSTPKILNGYLISAADYHPAGLAGDQDQSVPATSEEDEDEDGDDKIEPSSLKAIQVAAFLFSYRVHQDQLYRDPQTEIVSPPPKL